MRSIKLSKLGTLLPAITMALVALVGPARLASGQGEVKPGPEHALLKESEGVWDATVKAGGAESKGTSTGKVGLNGLWLLEEFKGEIGGMLLEGRSSTSYDPAKKKYITIWIDSMSTSPMIIEGTYDKATKTMTQTGTMPMPDGTSMKATATTVTKDADTRIFMLKATGPDGNDFELFQVTYKRRAK